MNLILKIVNNPKEGIASPSHEFKQEGGDIGRGGECAWVIPDKSKTISSLHAQIEYRRGVYYFIDMSSNGTLYKHANKRVPPQELVILKEGEVLCMGTYEILVGFLKSQNKDNAIDELLNMREIDVALEENLLLRREGESALDLILKEKVEDKDILELANITKKEDQFFADDAFDDAPDETNLYNSHITAPSFEEKPKEPVTVANNEEVLLSVFSSRLGINLESMNRQKQIELVSELAELILVSVEGVERLSINAKEIQSKLETPNYKVKEEKHAEVKTLLKNMLHSKVSQSTSSASSLLRRKLEHAKEQHTALYEASKQSHEELQDTFAPKNLSKILNTHNSLLSFFCKDAETWRAYVTKYQELNNELSHKNSFQTKMLKKYQSILETFSLARGNK